MSTVSEPAEIRESADRVTGKIRYVDDLPVAGALHGVFVRLPCARARIASIDAAPALAVPGVAAVLTEALVNGEPARYGVIARDQPILAVGETKYWGDPVALVLADDEMVARRAAGLVRVDYEELPAVLREGEALATDAPLVQDPALRPRNALNRTNIMRNFELSWGDVEAARDATKVTITGSYSAPYIHHFALEPYSCIASVDGEVLTITTAIQHPFQMRRIVAEMLDIPQTCLRVQGLDQGGGFGGRGYPKAEPAAAFAAWKLRRTVKIRLTAEEGFMVGQRESATIHAETGFDETGRITFLKIETNLGVGAYADVAPRVVGKAGMLGTGPYAVPAADITARGVFTHTAPTTAFRGFGATHVSFAVEGQMDAGAAALGMDPVAVRKENLPTRGQVFIPGETACDGDWITPLEMVARKLAIDEPLPAGVGRGIAIGVKNSIPATTSFARVRLCADGSLTVYVGTTEMGQGSRTTMAKIAARTLGVPLDAISVIAGDTDLVPFDSLTASSRSTVSMGNAVKSACEGVQRRIEEIRVRHGAEVDGSATYREVLAAHFGIGQGEIEATGEYQAVRDSSHPLGGPTPFYEYLVTGVEVVVDTDTGQVTVTKLITVTDAGRIVNPRRAEGLDEGGAVMGLGFTCLEQLSHGTHGQILNPGSLDYRIPAIDDVPHNMHSEFVENGDGPGPFGEKGMGEGGILAVAPAVAAAVEQAAKVRIRTLPFTAERVWTAIQSEEGEGDSSRLQTSQVRPTASSATYNTRCSI